MTDGGQGGVDGLRPCAALAWFKASHQPAPLEGVELTQMVFDGSRITGRQLAALACLQPNEVGSIGCNTDGARNERQGLIAVLATHESRSGQRVGVGHLG